MTQKQIEIWNQNYPPGTMVGIRSNPGNEVPATGTFTISPAFNSSPGKIWVLLQGYDKAFKLNDVHVLGGRI